MARTKTSTPSSPAKQKQSVGGIVRTLADKVTSGFTTKRRIQPPRTAKESLQRILHNDQEPKAKAQQEAQETELIRRTRRNHEKVKAVLKDAEAKFKRTGWIRIPGKRYHHAGPFYLRNAQAWEERRRQEYEDALEGRDTTDMIACLIEEEEERRGRPLPCLGPRAGKRLKAYPLHDVPGEMSFETHERILIESGYNPLLLERCNDPGAQRLLDQKHKEYMRARVRLLKEVQEGEISSGMMSGESGFSHSLRRTF